VVHQVAIDCVIWNVFKISRSDITWMRGGS